MKNQQEWIKWEKETEELRQFVDQDRIPNTIPLCERHRIIERMCDNPLSRSEFSDVIAHSIGDVVDPSPSYLKVLRAVVNAYNLLESQNDNLYSPLVEIGRVNPTLTSELILLIGSPTTPVDAVLAGYLIGGIANKQKDDFFTISQSPYDTCMCNITTVVSLRVAYYKQTLEVSDEIKGLSETLMPACPDAINQLVHLALDHYSEDPEGWFSLLFDVLDGASEDILRTFFFRVACSGQLLKSNHFFPLIQRHQSNNSVMDDISIILLHYSDSLNEIMDLVFPWIVSGRIHWIETSDHFLQKLASANPMVIREYVCRYVTWHHNEGFGHFPHAFPPLAKADPHIAFEAICEISTSDSRDRCAIIELAWVLVKGCAKYPKFTSEMRLLYRYLERIGEYSPLSQKSALSILDNLGPLEGGKYDRLVDTLVQMLERLENGPVHVDMPVIRQMLIAYPTLGSLITPILDEFESSGRCSSLIDLLASATPSSEISNGPFGQKEATALLRVFETGSRLYISKPNGRLSTLKDKKASLTNEFGNHERFESLLAEHLLFSRLEPVLARTECVLGDDPNNADIDLEVAVDGARFFIEIFASQEQRDARLSNEASFLSSRVADAIGKKYNDMMKSGAHALVEKDAKAFYLIAIDITKLPLSRFDAAEGILGPLVVEYETGPDANPQHNRIFRDPQQSKLFKLKHAPLISGLILYSLDFNREDGGCEAGIKGTLVHNPQTEKPLSPNFDAELSRILFRSTTKGPDTSVS